MATDIQLTYTLATESLTYFASNVTGATWTLTNTTTPDSLAHQISIRNDSATDHSAKTVVITGKAYGKSVTETIALPGANATVESSYYYTELTSLVPSTTIGSDTMDIGYVDEVATPPIVMNTLRQSQMKAVGVAINGTVNYTLQYTLFNTANNAVTSIVWQNFDDTALVSATTNQCGTFFTPPYAVRVKTNSYSTGAILTVVIPNT